MNERVSDLRSREEAICACSRSERAVEYQVGESWPRKCPLARGDFDGQKNG